MLSQVLDRCGRLALLNVMALTVRTAISFKKNLSVSRTTSCVRMSPDEHDHGRTVRSSSAG